MKAALTQSDNGKRWGLITAGLILLGVAGLSLSSSGGAAGEEQRLLAEFNRIQVGGLVNVNLIEGDEYKTDIRASGIALDDIITEVNGDILLVTTQGYHHKESIEIDVYHKGIIGVKTSGSATIESEDTLEADTLTVEIGGNGDATLTVDVDTLVVDMRGNGNFTVKGDADKQRVRAYGGGGTYDNSGLDF